MKKTLLTLFVALAITAQSIAQQIPNAGFENWVSVLNYQEPTGWATANAVTLISPNTPAPVSKVSPGNGGSASAIKVLTQDVTVFGQTSTIPGISLTGNSDNSSDSEDEENLDGQGFPFTGRPTSFSGFYKYAPTSVDTAVVYILLSKWNTILHQRDSIGAAFFFTKSITSLTTFASFTSPFYYTPSTSAPDTATVVIYSGENAGSYIIIDDLSLAGATGVSNPLISNFTKAFPNPAKEELNLINVPTAARTIEIKDMTGRSLETITANANNTINVSGYANGLYHYLVKDNNGALLYMDKFTVIK